MSDARDQPEASAERTRHNCVGPPSAGTPADQNIGPTAHYTAYAWHRLGLPYAEHFATPRGRALYWAFRGAGEWIALASKDTPLLVDVLEYRHRTIDACVREARAETIVEIGAGLSRRGVWAVRDMGVQRYVEVDLPHMIAAKRARLDALPADVGASIRGGIVLEARDILSDGFGAWLAGELRGTRALVIAEGVMGYFDLPERERIARAVAEGLRAAKRGAFLCDLRDAEKTRRAGIGVPVLRGAVRLVTRGRGLRQDFASEAAIRDFFAGVGLQAEPVAASSARAMPTRIWRAAP
jgi:O-methyltransferase involved in polyketide biosynthesis